MILRIANVKNESIVALNKSRWLRALTIVLQGTNVITTVSFPTKIGDKIEGTNCQIIDLKSGTLTAKN